MLRVEGVSGGERRRVKGIAELVCQKRKGQSKMVFLSRSRYIVRVTPVSQGGSNKGMGNIWRC